MERDRRLARHRAILKRTLGISDLPASSASPQEFLEQILRPQVQQATLQYALALDVITVLRDDTPLTERFAEEYDKYIERLRFQKYNDEVTQPPYKWHHYNRSVVFRLAKEVARTNGTTPIGLDRLAGWDQAADANFGLKVNGATGEVTPPQVTISLRSKSDSNLKNIEHYLTVVEPFVKSLRAYWFTIAPVSPGAKIRRKGDSLDPSIVEADCNLPDYHDYQTFKGIWERNSLYYCNKEWLLRSLDLRAHHFGFDGYEPEGLSSYVAAHLKYEAWYKTHFEPQLELYASGDPRRRPRYEIYISIRTILMKQAQIQGDSPISFRDFMLEVFSEVIRELNISKAHNQDKAGHVMDLDRDIKRSYWDRVHELLKHAPHDQKELAARVSELLLPAQNRLQVTATKIMEAIDNLTALDRAQADPAAPVNPWGHLDE